MSISSLINYISLTQEVRDLWSDLVDVNILGDSFDEISQGLRQRSSNVGIFGVIISFDIRIYSPKWHEVCFVTRHGGIINTVGIRPCCFLLNTQ